MNNMHNIQASFGDLNPSNESDFGLKKPQGNLESTQVPISSSQYISKNAQTMPSYSSYVPSLSNMNQQNQILLSNKTQSHFDDEYVQRVLNEILGKDKPAPEQFQQNENHNGPIVSFSSSFQKSNYEDPKIDGKSIQYTDKTQQSGYEINKKQENGYVHNGQIQDNGSTWGSNPSQSDSKQIKKILNQNFIQNDHSIEMKRNTFSIPSTSIQLVASSPISQRTNMLGTQEYSRQQQDYPLQKYFLDGSSTFGGIEQQSYYLGESNNNPKSNRSFGEYSERNNQQQGDLSVGISTDISQNIQQHKSEITKNIFPSLATVQVLNKNIMADSHISGTSALSTSSYIQLNDNHSPISHKITKDIKDYREKLETKEDNQTDRSQGISYLQESRFSFQKPMTNARCQECAVLQQKIDFLQLEQKETQERIENANKLNETLMITLGKDQEKGGAQTSSYQVILAQHERDIEGLREQLRQRAKKEEMHNREWAKNMEELEFEKRGIEMSLNNLRQVQQTQVSQLTEAQTKLREKDTKIESLVSEMKKLEIKASCYEDKERLQNEMESLKIRQQLEIERIKGDAEKECTRLNLILQKTAETFETKVKSLFEEKNLIEKQTSSNAEICQHLRSRLADEVAQLKSQRILAAQCIEEQKKELEQQKGLAGKQTTLVNQVEEQAQAIQRLKQVQNAYDKLQMQFAESSVNLADLGQRLKEQQQENAEFKVKRDTERKKEKGKYDELLGKLNAQELKQEQVKKDFERKSAMIIRELLNKDMKIRELQGKLNPRSSDRQEKDRSPLARLLQEEKQVSEHPLFVEFNKSQLLQNTTDKANPNDDDPESSRSKSPMSDKKNTNTTSQFWKKFMDSSNIASQSAQQVFSPDQSHIAIKQECYLDNQQPSVISSIDSNNFSKLKLSMQPTKEIMLKKELHFVIEQFIQILANLIVSELRGKDESTDHHMDEEITIKVEADKHLKIHLKKLQEKSMQQQMQECSNILEAIVSSTGAASLQSEGKQSNFKEEQQSFTQKKSTIHNLVGLKNKGSFNTANKSNNHIGDPFGKGKASNTPISNTSSSFTSSNLQNKSTHNSSLNSLPKRNDASRQFNPSNLSMIQTNCSEMSPRGDLSQQQTSSSKVTDVLKEIKKKSLTPVKTPTGKGSQKFSNYFSKQNYHKPSVSPNNRSHTQGSITPNKYQ